MCIETKRVRFVSYGTKCPIKKAGWELALRVELGAFPI
jgi:hypothetical protein